MVLMNLNLVYYLRISEMKTSRDIENRAQPHRQRGKQKGNEIRNTEKKANTAEYETVNDSNERKISIVKISQLRCAIFDLSTLL